MKILIFGISGSGKTHLAELLNEHLQFNRINGDAVRKMVNDWDFSELGRIRQAKRIACLAENSSNVIIDFIAPLQEMRNIVRPTYTIWMNTTEKSQYTDTDSIFEPPTSADLVITSFGYDVQEIVNNILNHNNRTYNE